MKKIFKCLGTLLYSTIVGYLIWLLFYWITPYIMGVGWLLFFLYIFLAGAELSTSCTRGFIFRFVLAIYTTSCSLALRRMSSCQANSSCQR